MCKYLTSNLFRIEVVKNKSVSLVLDNFVSPGFLSDYIFIFAHGSSNDLNHPLLKGITKEYTANGAACLRFNFLFKEENFFENISDNNLAAYVNVFNFVKKELNEKNKKVIVCGKSLGAKVAARAISERLITPHGFIAFGYPLHSYNTPNILKQNFIKNIKIPCLFFCGTKDPLCNHFVLEKCLKELELNFAIDLIKNGDHGLGIEKQYNPDIFSQILNSTKCWLEL